MAEVHLPRGREAPTAEQEGRVRSGFRSRNGSEERTVDLQLHGGLLEPVHGREEVRDQLPVDGGLGLSMVHRRLLRVRRPRLRLVRHQRKSVRDVQL